MPTKLGQNFLRDEKVLKKIIAAADLKADDFVIEIGPGEGVLTEELAKRAGKVIAIEVDEVLSKLLRNKFSNKKNVEIINEDILKINFSELATSYKLQAIGYKIVANLPYYITSPIIRLFLEADCPPREMILMVQKEVAERIVAGLGKMSILAVSVQYYAHPEMLFTVSKNAFFPVPEVDSAIIRVTHIVNRVSQNKEDVKDFFRVVRAGFSAKRKMLVNNLSSSFHLDKKEVEEKIKKIPLSGKVRAQELSVEEWKKLTKLFG
ncbi:MAG: ribosomal RNA small subunit methyltransferase A [Candidatus Moranbacteria bacterium CG_4_9_14_3_um_filter_42_9]|nr:MAG: ribosomal RNA small subunit methyltransferase A [Candidatus Moranbacteria bacterium CG_4_9_14_3_um_filter_42_9]